MALIPHARFSYCNTQVIRIQPQESIYLKINNKVPGLGLRLENTRLDLPFHAIYDQELPDAYERLLLDVINGEQKHIFLYGNHEISVSTHLSPSNIFLQVHCNSVLI